MAASLEAGAEVESLYRPVGKEDDGNGCLLDKLAEKSSENEKVLDKIVVKELLSGLGRQEQEIIIRRYFENQTQTKIAEDLHISQVQVSRLEKKILRQLREKLAGG